MVSNPFEEVDIKEIIANKDITIYFQPIVSVVKREVIGVEALCRSFCHKENIIIPPYVLFKLAAEEGLSIELDRLCREVALKSFQELYAANPNLLLFVNFDTSILDLGVAGSGHLINYVNEIGIPPENIVIEIHESEVSDIGQLKKFISLYKEYGFLVALDDVGAGFSNLDRIPITEPDILKIDRGLLKNIGQDHYKQEIFNSLIKLSKKIGALVIAEGIETEEEAMLSLELGADMLQGFYYGKPGPFSLKVDRAIHTQLKKSADKFKEHMLMKNAIERNFHETCNEILEVVLKVLKNYSRDNFDESLFKLVQKYSLLDGMYILDEHGIQVSDTFLNSPKQTTKKLFQPAQKGTDHSLKSYVLALSAGKKQFQTDTYISLATGQKCITIATHFKVKGNRNFIVCLDINPHFNFRKEFADQNLCNNLRG